MAAGEEKIIDAMVEAAATFLGVEPRSDDPDMPAVRNCMKAVLARLRADGVVVAPPVIL